MTARSVVEAELLDVVDADDRVIAVATRGEIHRRALCHRAVHILIENAAGAIYVQRRALDKDCDPGCWDTSAAGHVDHGEDYAAAARRELAEELGLYEVPLVLLGMLPASAVTGHEFVAVYRGQSVCEPVPNATEIIAGGWWSRAAIAAWIARAPAEFTTSFQCIFARYCASDRAVP